MSNAEFILVDHQNSIAKLRASMERVGAGMSPDAFIRAVSNAYHEVEAQRQAIDMPAYFRSNGAYHNFKQALLVAREALNRPLSILNIGGGAGYDLEVLREVFSTSEIKKIVCCDISADMQALAREKANGYPCRFVLGCAEETLIYGPYDLVVTHAMVHHVPDLFSFFNAIRLAVAPGGGYVMGHEPNRRYWANPECMAILKKVQAAERRRLASRKYLSPSLYLYNLSRVLGLAADNSLWTRVNRILQKRYGFASDLTPQEIQRLVDVHIPDGFQGGFKIGFDGFDWQQLQSEFLQDFGLVWVSTSGYLGDTHDHAALPRQWSEAEVRLAKKYPLDGSNFSAFWQRVDGR